MTTDMTMTAIAGTSTAYPPTDGLQAKTTYIQLAETGFSDTVLKALDRLREKSVLTDAIICVEDQELHCHKVVLSSCSDVFCQMFSTSTNDTTQRIYTSIVSADTMRLLVDFVYKGKVEVKRNEVKKLQAASKLYGVCSLSQLCERSLEIVKQEPVLDSVGSDNVEAGVQQSAGMSVLDSDTDGFILARVRVKEEDICREVGETIYTNDGNGCEAMDWKSNRHGNRAINSFSTQCQSTSNDRNQGHCQLDDSELSDASGAKRRPEKTISVKIEPFSPDDPEYWHSSRYQDGDADFNTMRNKQSSADTSEDLQDGSDDDDQQFYIATEVSGVAMAIDDSFKEGRRELSSTATKWIATGHGGNADTDNTWELQEVVHEGDSETASQYSNTLSHTGTLVKRSVYPIYNRALTGTALPVVESTNGMQEDSEQQSENEVRHGMGAQFETLGSESQSVSSVVLPVINTCSDSLAIKQHCSEISRSKYYTCKVCGEVFNPFSLFCLHVKQRALGQSQNVCPLCEHTFSSFCGLGRHFKILHKNKMTSVKGHRNAAILNDCLYRYRCQTCGKVFIKFAIFKIHEKQHEQGVSELQCPLCGWDYKNFKNVLIHFKRTHKSQLQEWEGNS
ncbi:zinc finger and BTB domain-containing protein 18-like isoform X2 [Ptychodera flava]|uniref:zinc finger and BTB domain-containing protein 18-like isoform X2 n=1 Tax=Ptychodera flava TaxID=63121 RepID=UPI003969ED40